MSSGGGVILTDSTVSGNFTTGGCSSLIFECSFLAQGGGVFASGNVTITDSTIDLDGQVDFSGGTFAQYSIALGRHGDPGSTSYGLSTASVLAVGLGLTEADVYDDEDDALLGPITLLAEVVPTLSEWGFILLILLLAASATFYTTNARRFTRT